MAKLWQLLKGRQNPAFSGKAQRVDQGKFFKNRPKSSPRLKALWRKWQYPLISMHLRCNDLRRFWSKKVAPKVPEWPSYGSFSKVTKNPHFLKSANGGPREIFQKSPKK